MRSLRRSAGSENFHARREGEHYNPEGEMEEYPKSLVEFALNYLRLGFSVIPVSSANKKPLVKWEEFQHRHPTEEETRKWFQNPQTQVAVVTGAISGIAVVDVEAGGSIDEFPKTATSKTGGGGWHLWYKHPGHPVDNAVKIKPLVDIRGDGGYVVAPPSLHSSGGKRRVCCQHGGQRGCTVFRRRPPVYIHRAQCSLERRPHADHRDTRGGHNLRDRAPTRCNSRRLNRRGI